MTAMGMILGTAAYMAPEQARGRIVDKRVDIWAFGLVLYEMLTGRAAFAGDTITDIIAAVVTREPDWTALPATTPASIRRLLTRCLEKDPKRRLRDIGDARLEIEEAIERGPASGSAGDSVASPARHAARPGSETRLDSGRCRTGGRCPGRPRRVRSLATGASSRHAPAARVDRPHGRPRSRRARNLTRRPARRVPGATRRRHAAALGAGPGERRVAGPARHRGRHHALLVAGLARSRVLCRRGLEACLSGGRPGSSRHR